MPPRSCHSSGREAIWRELAVRLLDRILPLVRDFTRQILDVMQDLFIFDAIWVRFFAPIDDEQGSGALRCPGFLSSHPPQRNNGLTQQTQAESAIDEGAPDPLPWNALVLRLGKDPTCSDELAPHEQPYTKRGLPSRPWATFS